MFFFIYLKYYTNTVTIVYRIWILNFMCMNAISTLHFSLFLQLSLDKNISFWHMVSWWSLTHLHFYNHFLKFFSLRILSTHTVWLELVYRWFPPLTFFLHLQHDCFNFTFSFSLGSQSSPHAASMYMGIEPSPIAWIVPQRSTAWVKPSLTFPALNS